MTFYQIIQQLQRGEYQPIYFLEGEESYFIDEIVDFISENALSDAEKGFNQVTLYGRDTTIEEIVSAARRFPMMASRQVVIVKEAQEIRKIDDLKLYTDAPLHSTILVVVYRDKVLDGRSALAKSLKSNGLRYTAKKLYDNQVPDWIAQRIRERGFTIEPKATLLISESVGNDLSKLSNELDKLTISLKEGDNITTAIVEKNIGISKDFNTFELQDAIAFKDVLKANRIIRHMGNNPKAHSIIPIISLLFLFYKKLLTYHYQTNKNNSAEVARAIGVHQFFLKTYQTAARNYNIRKTVEVIGILRDIDRKSKGLGAGSATEMDLMVEMVYRILH